MIRDESVHRTLIALGMLLAVNVYAVEKQAPPPAAKPKGPPAPPVVGVIQTGLEPKAVDILKAASSRLAAEALQDPPPPEALP
jgi:hypothetical protein